MGNAGFALLAAMLGAVLIVMGARGTYPDVANLIIHPQPGDMTTGGSSRGTSAGPGSTAGGSGKGSASGPGESIFGIRL